MNAYFSLHEIMKMMLNICVVDTILAMEIFTVKWTMHSIFPFTSFGWIVCRSLTKEKSGACSLVLERPFAPFPIHQLYRMDDIDILFNRGRVPISTWNKSIQASSMQDSSESSGNSGFAVFCPKFLNSQGWKYLNDQNKNGQPQAARNASTLPFSPLVAIFTEEMSENAEWGHGNFPLEEYVKALDRSKGELYYNHSLGMRYSKVCF